MHGPGCAIWGWELESVSNSRRLQGWASTGLVGLGTPLPQASASAGFLSSPGSPALGPGPGLGGAHLFEVQFGCHSGDGVQPCQLGRRSVTIFFARCQVLCSREGPRPLGHGAKTPRNPAPEVATVGEGHLDHFLEVSIDFLCRQAEHWTEALCPWSSPSPSPSGRSPAPNPFYLSLFTSDVSLHRSVFQPTMMGTSLQK